MAHRGPLPDVDTSAVTEVAAATLAPLWTEAWRGHPDAGGAPAIAQLVEARYPRRNAYDVSYFAVRVGNEIAGYCELFSDGSTGQVENVLVFERYRGRGLGKAVTARALGASWRNHDLTFLVADADDWPKELYAGLGFEGIGSTWAFIRRPPES
jgi:ribosomal protein S18 acetylase RimI-like enzyme